MCVMQKSYFLNFVRVPKAIFQFKIPTINVISGVVYFREIILESSQKR